MKPSIEPGAQPRLASRWRGRGSWRRRLIRAVGFAAILGPLTCAGIHDDELHCEEAVAHLRSCCANFDPGSVTCSQNPSCGNSPHPELSLDQSSCILDRSCADLNSNINGSGTTCELVMPDAQNSKSIPPLCP